MLTVVVGAGPGMGLALARRFGRDGEVALVVRRLESGEPLVEELVGEGTRAACYVADVGDEDSLRAAFAAIRESRGEPDVVLVNTSIAPGGTPAEVTAAELRTAFDAGVVGAVVAYQETVPAMVARGSGTYLVTGSGVALRPWSGGVALTVAKTALRAFVMAAAQEVADSGVRVGTVTVAGTLGKPGFEPDTVAERFWELHTRPREGWEPELVHRGAG